MLEYLKIQTVGLLQHTRQLEDILQGLEIEPRRAVVEQDLEGPNMPRGTLGLRAPLGTPAGSARFHSGSLGNPVEDVELEVAGWSSREARAAHRRAMSSRAHPSRQAKFSYQKSSCGRQKILLLADSDAIGARAVALGGRQGG
jgi:hypothetical protein